MQNVLTLVQRGRLTEARKVLEKQLARRPNDGPARRLLGKVLFSLGDADDGIAHIRRALELPSAESGIACDLGTMLLARKAWDEAITAFRRELVGQPDHSDSLYNLAWSLRQVGCANEAVVYLRKLVSAHPRHSRGWFNLGNLLMDQGEHEQAVAAYRSVLTLAPNDVAVLVNLGEVLRRLERNDEAVAVFRRALSLEPGHIIAANNLGNLLTALGQIEAALSIYKQALTWRPEDATTLYNLALAEKAADRWEQAAARLLHVTALDPDMTDAWNALGTVYLLLEMLSEAEMALRRAMTLQPHHAHVWNNLGLLHGACGQGELAIASYRRALELAPSNAAIHSNLLFQMVHQPGLSRQEVFDEHRRYGTCQETLAEPLWIPTPTPDDSRPLRIGYVSPDFREHAVTILFESVLKHHDPRVVETTCYDIGNRPDMTTTRLQARANRWRTIGHLSPDAAACLIRDDNIDILVDLAGHTSGNGLPIFARKPAPIQATWLGYPGTTGLTRIDYRLTDSGADPPGVTDDFHTESLERLDCITCFRPPIDTPEVQLPPMINRGRVRFGSFNKPQKLGPAVIGAWSRLLTALPDAELLLVVSAGDQPIALHNWRSQFAAYGIAPERILVTPRQSLRGFLELVAGVDVALDPFPYGGGTTSMFTLWMGVPLVCLDGADSVSGSAALLRYCGLCDLVAETADGDVTAIDRYVSIATALAADYSRLCHLRATLRPALLASPLMDDGRLARLLEEKYRQWWHCLIGGRKVR